VSIIWGLYSGTQLSLISVTAPIYFRNIPTDLELRKTSADKVEVQITGKRQLVAALRPDQVRAFLDLQGIERGSHRLDLSADNIGLPPGLNVVRITPSSIKVDMDPFAVKEVSVKVEVTGSPPDGYRLDSVRVKPRSVKVSGPESTLPGISDLYTEPIDLATLEAKNGEKTLDVPLVLFPASLRLLPTENKTVRVTVTLRPVKAAAGSTGANRP
jgi:YbbR domain-containing protein